MLFLLIFQVIKYAIPIHNSQVQSINKQFLEPAQYLLSKYTRPMLATLSLVCFDYVTSGNAKSHSERQIIIRICSQIRNQIGIGIENGFGIGMGMGIGIGIGIGIG